MKFNSQKLIMAIELKAMESGQKPSKIRRDIVSRFNITRQALSNWEHGQCPKVSQLFELKKYFNIPNIENFFKEA